MTTKGLWVWLAAGPVQRLFCSGSELISAVLLSPVLDSATSWTKGREHLMDSLGEFFIIDFNVTRLVTILNLLTKIVSSFGIYVWKSSHTKNINKSIVRLKAHRQCCTASILVLYLLWVFSSRESRRARTEELLCHALQTLRAHSQTDEDPQL